jgi:hypothetical protein
MATVGGAIVVWLLIGPGFVNYDTLFNLGWGDDLRHGREPELELPLAPTQKPLVIAAGTLLTPLGHASQSVVVVGALLAMGALAVAVGALAAHFARWQAGLLAAGLVLTREPILSFGVRAYIDIPYVALVLFALLLALRRAGHGKVLSLLALAGLLRPEAWAFSLVYLLVAARSDATARRPTLGALAVSAPVIWCMSDLLLTGSPLFSLTGTRANAAFLERETGLLRAIELAPRRLGEIVREPVLVGALGGAALLLNHDRASGRQLIGAVALALSAFGIFATAGLPVLGRYLMLVASLLIVIAAIGVVRAIQLGRAGHPAWGAFAAVACVLLAMFAVPQVNRLDRLRSTLATQRSIADDLHDLADSGALSRCGKIRLPNHRVRPMLAAWLDVPAQTIAAGGPPTGTALVPATARVERLFILDPRDRVSGASELPPDAVKIAGNASWAVYTRCVGSRTAMP